MNNTPDLATQLRTEREKASLPNWLAAHLRKMEENTHLFKTQEKAAPKAATFIYFH